MGLLSFVFGLPFAPVRALISLAEVIQERVEQELHDPAVARRELEQVEEASARGELSPDAVAEAEYRVTGRMTQQSTAGAMAAESEHER
ncbi:gas vesicle protein GvpG [Pseudonocardia sp. DSM 110487]|uniref:gas vesicle protein GvpG n=1 Tax=Pseudonocardia sp. DSM 110487 TaxID=2865833 RepID=UPI001C6985AE|nr:gas vesicle protein GvpG [Pseudonocardia sp. DSM 110487]QYN38091.1 gas vesicle protein GvpG [Pseudonocardia sp. DSM 110487]